MQCSAVQCNALQCSVRDVVLWSYADAKFNSFKLSVSLDDADKAMNPLIWGCGKSSTVESVLE